MEEILFFEKSFRGRYSFLRARAVRTVYDRNDQHNRLLFVFPLDVRDLLESAGIALLFSEGRRKENFHDVQRGGIVNKVGGETQNVRVVIVARLVGVVRRHGQHGGRGHRSSSQHCPSTTTVACPSRARLHVSFPPAGGGMPACHCRKHVSSPTHWSDTYCVTFELHDAFDAMRAGSHVPGVGCPKSAKSTLHTNMPSGHPSWNVAPITTDAEYDAQNVPLASAPATTAAAAATRRPPAFFVCAVFWYVVVRDRDPLFCNVAITMRRVQRPAVCMPWTPFSARWRSN